MRSLVISVFLSLLVFCGLSACGGNDRPEGVLSPKEMENVMHDLHLAQALDQMSEHIDTATLGAVDKVYEKYNLKQSDLDSSLAYYSHHVDKLIRIYENLNDRYAEEASELGIRQVKVGNSGFASGDTLDVWVNSRLATLSASPLKRLLKFELLADTTYYQRDLFQLQGFVHFIGRLDEQRNNGVALALTVVYDNDSLQTTTRTVTSSQQFYLELPCDSVRDVKSIYGFMSLTGKSSQPAVIENIRLLKMHRRALMAKESQNEEPTDSVEGVE